MVTIGLLLCIASIASFGYYYFNKRRQFQHGQPLSTPSDSSTDVERLQGEIIGDDQNNSLGKIGFDRRFDNLS